MALGGFQGFSGSLPLLDASTSPTCVGNMRALPAAQTPGQPLGRCLEFSSPSCWVHLVWIPERPEAGCLTGSAPSPLALSQACLCVKATGLWDRKELGRHEDKAWPHGKHCLFMQLAQVSLGRLAALGLSNQVSGSPHSPAYLMQPEN